MEKSVRPVVYTPKMLAQRWQCSERHIRNMIKAGLIPAFRLGGKLVRIGGDDVLKIEASASAEIDADVGPSTVQISAIVPQAQQLPYRMDPLKRAKISRLRKSPK
ncbi:helix-turn-helix domain-containing protein [Phyllobacterium sp. OV277]|uniref:helix-turn-helix domain-containing protein n=1 Tax=Phyllobacterium sp. OV277 TaxID=1882772 RepID=UPI00244E8BC1|nr:helix-turn-helix domain-containing protein [Phyllobacterium sp. OV277]